MKIGNPADKPAPTPANGNAVAANDAAKAQANASAKAEPGAKPEASAKIELSSATSTLLAGSATPEFDADKVARITQAISDGSFQVNADVIADKLIANASELLGRGRH